MKGMKLPVKGVKLTSNVMMELSVMALMGELLLTSIWKAVAVTILRRTGTVTRTEKLDTSVHRIYKLDICTAEPSVAAKLQQEKNKISGCRNIKGLFTQPAQILKD